MQITPSVTDYLT